MWSTPQILGHERESRRKAGRHRRPSNTGSIHPGELLNITGPPTWARFSWDSWSTLQALGLGTEAPGIDGRPHGHSYQGPSRPGQVVEPAGHRTQAPFAQEN